MARYLGPGAIVGDPDGEGVWTTEVATAWAAETGLKPPAYMIGIGGFGVTYRAVSESGEPVALKEYFPRAFAKRDTRGQVAPRAVEGSERIFQEGLKRFLLEGRLLAAFDHPGINRVTASFELNGTAYHVSPLIEGREQLGGTETGAVIVERRVTLEHYLRDVEATEGQHVDLALLRPLLEQLLDAVDYVHTTGTALAREITGEEINILLHRDIKPSNILVVPPDELREAAAADVLRHSDTRLVLIDFGSARVIRDNDDVTRTIGVVTEAFAPPELKDNQIEAQGAHTDIYSLAALIWRAFQGRPPSGTDLLGGAKLRQLIRPVPGDDTSATRAPARFLRAVDKGLNQQGSKRPQSIAEWRAELFADGPDIEGEDEDQPPKGRSKTLPRPVLIGGGAGVAAAVIGGIVFMVVSSGGAALEKHIMTQAETAYRDALAAAQQGESQALEGESQARKAVTEVGQVTPLRDEATARYERYEQSLKPLEIFHGWNVGSSYYGDVQITTGDWCHRKGPNIRPMYSYSSYYGIQADTGIRNYEGRYACGPSHTHLIEQTFSETRNPWKVSSDYFVYLGEVDETQQPLGLGEMTWAGRTVRGRVTTSGGEQTWVGNASPTLFGETRLSGSLTFTPNESGEVPNWTGEEYTGDRLQFRGQSSGAVRTGLFVFKDGRRASGVSRPNDLIQGRLTLPSGGTWTGVFSRPDTTPKADALPSKTWGRLEDGGRIYWGQVVEATPSGCGVWVEANGRRQAGYFEGSTKVPDRADSCRNEFYVAPDAAATTPAAP